VDNCVSNWPHSVFGQNHLFVKMLFKQGFHYSEGFQMILHCFQDRSFQSSCQPFQTPVSHPDDRAISSGRPFVYYSIRPDDVPYRSDARQTKASSVRTTCIPVRTFTIFEKLLFQVASVRTSQQPFQTPLSDRSALYSFQVQFKGRLLQPS